MYEPVFFKSKAADHINRSAALHGVWKLTTLLAPYISCNPADIRWIHRIFCDSLRKYLSKALPSLSVKILQPGLQLSSNLQCSRKFLPLTDVLAYNSAGQVICECIFLFRSHHLRILGHCR